MSIIQTNTTYEIKNLFINEIYTFVYTNIDNLNNLILIIMYPR